MSRNLFMLVVVGLIAGLSWLAYRQPDNNVDWTEDYQAAVAEAKQTGRPILLYFTADWCGPCREMKRSVWPDPQVEQLVDEKLVALHLDVDSSDARPIAERYDIRGIPTMIVVDAEGNPMSDEFGQALYVGGGLPKADMLAFLRRVPGLESAAVTPVAPPVNAPQP